MAIHGRTDSEQEKSQFPFRARSLLRYLLPKKSQSVASPWPGAPQPASSHIADSRSRAALLTATAILDRMLDHALGFRDRAVTLFSSTSTIPDCNSNRNTYTGRILH
ncbi:hypothetical protein CH35J_004005 [Colletotrichum higginsianum]|uniref:Uncharacterized protein n=1 Tax=Colletotrichum higginsianum TaxID=80884 RepID=A0A4T0W965_9PEZI|nr:hypothetical protein CH35J_004005 [Colletotrichum higginsianum]